MIIRATKNNNWKERVEYFVEKKLNENKEVFIEIKDRKPKRSLAQNAYFHGVYLPLIGEFTGYIGREELEALKTYLKKRLGYCKQKVYRTKDGLVSVDVCKSTADMSKDEFSEFILRIQELTGVVAPPTDEFGL